MKTELIKNRAIYSQTKLGTLETFAASELSILKIIPENLKITMFAAGSYGRLEASQHSDMDLFFVIDGKKGDKETFLPKSNQFRLFSTIIDIGSKHGFPEFSNDCEFLCILYSNDLIRNIGNRKDDFENTLTARMLLILESRPFYNNVVYTKIKRDILQAYYRDYDDHSDTFEPRFLINDLWRFWYTLCVNYEKGRESDMERGYTLSPEELSKEKIKDKVKNYKLKLSRKLTCVATLATLMAHNKPVSITDIEYITSLPTLDRIIMLEKLLPSTKHHIKEVLNHYTDFMSNTDKSKQELRDLCANKDDYSRLLKEANDFKGAIHALLNEIVSEKKINIWDLII